MKVLLGIGLVGLLLLVLAMNFWTIAKLGVLLLAIAFVGLLLVFAWKGDHN